MSVYFVSLRQLVEPYLDKEFHPGYYVVLVGAEEHEEELRADGFDIDDSSAECNDCFLAVMDVETLIQAAKFQQKYSNVCLGVYRVSEGGSRWLEAKELEEISLAGNIG